MTFHVWAWPCYIYCSLRIFKGLGILSRRHDRVRTTSQIKCIIRKPGWETWNWCDSVSYTYTNIFIRICKVLVLDHVIGVCQPSQSAPRKKTHKPLRTVNFSNMCPPCSRCVICVSCSVHVISTYYARKGLWAFYLNYPQSNEIGKSGHTKECSVYIDVMLLVIL